MLWCWIEVGTEARFDMAKLDKMLDRLENEYGFGDYTPMSEMWNYFDLTNYPVRQ